MKADISGPGVASGTGAARRPAGGMGWRWCSPYQATAARMKMTTVERVCFSPNSGPKPAVAAKRMMSPTARLDSDFGPSALPKRSWTGAVALP
ncbi:hypothetical protein AZH46_00400 [Corynebacterium striatum]|nr:hypothetical protein AZH46_00400 [Corynebacterium striatum]